MNAFERLRAHFDPSVVSWRPGRITTNDRGTVGMALAYINARDVMSRLDEVVGPENWSDAYVETAKGVMLCTLSIRIGNEWVGKTDGAGETDVEGEKGKVSDALKRAAVKWGIGRYLYDVPTIWVECDPKTKTITKRGYAELQEKLAAFGKRHVQAPLASPPKAQPEAAKEVIDPQTGEISPPPANVVRDVIAEHAPAPEAKPAEAQNTSKNGRPSCIISGKLSDEEIQARKEKEAAEAKQRFADESRATAESWVEMLRELEASAADRSVKTHTVVAEFEAWEQVRKAMWSKIAPADQDIVRKAFRTAKTAIDKRRASASAAA